MRLLCTGQYKVHTFYDRKISAINWWFSLFYNVVRQHETVLSVLANSHVGGRRKRVRKSENHHWLFSIRKSNCNIVKQHFLLAKYHKFWRMWSIPDLWHHMNSHSRLPSSRLVGLLVLDLRTIPKFFEALSEGLDWLWSSEVVCRYAIYGMMVAIYFYNLQTFDLHNQLYNALYIMGLSRWILTVNHWRLTVLDSLVWLISKLFSHIHPSI